VLEPGADVRELDRLVLVARVKLDDRLETLLEHPDDLRAQPLAAQDLLPLPVDERPLAVGHLVVLEQVLADVEVALLDLLLHVLDAARDEPVLDALFPP
jgi:hypothetical protein